MHIRILWHNRYGYSHRYPNHIKQLDIALFLVLVQGSKCQQSAKLNQITFGVPNPKESLESKFFTWKDWDEGNSCTDMYFMKVKMIADLEDFPKEKTVSGVDWMPSESKVVFYFTDDTELVYAMNLTLSPMKSQSGEN